MYFNRCKLFTCSRRAGLPRCLSCEGPGRIPGPDAELPSVTADMTIGWSARYYCCRHSRRWNHCSLWKNVCEFLAWIYNNKGVFTLNTGAFAWCALNAFTCRVSYKCGQTLGPLPRPIPFHPKLLQP